MTVFAVYARTAVRNEYGALVPRKRRLGEVEAASRDAALERADRDAERNGEDTMRDVSPVSRRRPLTSLETLSDVEWARVRDAAARGEPVPPVTYYAARCRACGRADCAGDVRCPGSAAWD